jgi:2-methylcitrate dehydratase PrpD
MDGSDRQQVALAVAELGRFAATFVLEDLRADVRADLDMVLIDTLGVTVAGARTPEHRALVAATGGADAGPARPRGTERRFAVEAAAFLDGTASCMLELDEGNKFSRGHPAAHVVPAVLALGASEDVDARHLLEAVLVGHEVAARFGRAVRLRDGFHPHGNWGVTGAAAAAARLLGCDADGIAGAIDAAAGLALAAPFDAALEGTFVRNTWIGAAAVSGIQAARLARAGLTTVDGTAASVLGRLIGTLDPAPLTDGLGERYDISLGYLKIHASCSYTHPPIDAALAIRAVEGFDADRIAAVEVRTHRLAVPLARTEPPTRLAAMFSIPHLVAAALRYGRVDVEASGSAARDDAAVRSLAARVRVVNDPAHDARAPAERPALVEVTMVDGSVLTHEVPNPIGDAHHHPLDRAGVHAKLVALIGEEDTSAIERVIDGIHAEPGGRARDLLDALP